MLNDIFKSHINEIKFGYLKRKHPFRYCYLSSVFENEPVVRTVVLRDATDEHELIFFTDSRSQKVEQFKTNPNAEVLFYHPKKLLQIKAKGTISFLSDDERLKYYRNKIQGPSINDYITKAPPSTPIKNPDLVEYNEDEVNFCVLVLKIETLEGLQLKRPNHIRTRFKRANDWKGEFLLP
jgi:pyridoxine/pyridoxamine 5'-phosphate oxidase